MTRAEIKGRLSALRDGDATSIGAYRVVAFHNGEGRRAFHATGPRQITREARTFIDAFLSAINAHSTDRTNPTRRVKS